MQESTAQTAGGVAESHPREWVLRRNCAISPYQLLAVFVSVAVVSLGIATVWGVLGHWVVLPYAILECLALGGAFLYYCRHAQDRERVSVSDAVVRIEEVVGGGSVVHELPRYGIVVRMASAKSDALVCLRSAGRQAQVGRFVDGEGRKQFFREFRQALGQGAV
ncbi:MAG: DUF2244 domain-containing protein [Burkholderiaceae bacterium]